MVAHNDLLHHTHADFRCQKCGTGVSLENFQGDDHLSESAAHALIDHLLLIESEIAEIRRLVLAEVLS
jgi:hypothetical protein